MNQPIRLNHVVIPGMEQAYINIKKSVSWLYLLWFCALEPPVCLCWGFTAQSTQWGHVERGQFT